MIKNFLSNVGDNAWYIVGMFDPTNQGKLLSLLSPESAKMVNDAIKGYA